MNLEWESSFQPLWGSWRKLRSEMRTEAITAVPSLPSPEGPVCQVFCTNSLSPSIKCPLLLEESDGKWHKMRNGPGILKHEEDTSLFYHKDITPIKTSLGSLTRPAYSHPGLCNCSPLSGTFCLLLFLGRAFPRSSEITSPMMPSLTTTAPTP